MNNPSLKIMQVYSTYIEFIHQFYNTHPCLANSDWKTQTNALKRYGFFIPHTLTDALQELGCTTEIVFSNSYPLQIAWAKEHGISLSNDKEWEKEILLARIESFQPDVLYNYSPYTFTSEMRTQLSWNPSTVVSWRCATLCKSWDWSCFDLILSSLPSILELAPQLGARRTALFGPGFPLRLVKELSMIPQDTDVVFSGTLFGKARIAAIDALASGARRYGYSLRLHLSGVTPQNMTPAMVPYLAPPVFAADHIRALRRGRIVLDARTPVYLEDNSHTILQDISMDDNCSMRLFEATGCGCMVLALQGRSRWFDWDKEIISYSNPQDLVDKVRYYLAHPEERNLVAAAGQQRCLEDYNIKRRAENFLTLSLHNIQDNGNASA